ncbi:MAG: hypothetical protein PHE21_02135 [Candidatus Dojkabacteria bacterium]|nr:hypothetical protein [Candidatus Dojkabacteria bacterium]
MNKTPIFVWVIGGIAIATSLVLTTYVLIKHFQKDSIISRKDGIYLEGNKILDKDELDGDVEDVVMSTDKKHMCVTVQTMAPKWLYYVQLTDGVVSEIFKIAPGYKCYFSNDNSMIAFIGHTTDVSANDLFVFFIESKEYKNYTNSQKDDGGMRIYSNPVWASDDTNIIAGFKEYDNSMTLIKEGSAQIRIDNMSVEDI